MKKASESNIDFSISKQEQKKKEKQLQRTHKWQEDRRGRWTGSQLKSLMSCGPGKSKLEWNNLDRLLSFGATAIKYIYENAMERKTGRYIDDGDGSWAMRYGTKVEPLIRKRTAEILKELGIKGKLKEVGFKQFPKIPNAGVSSDSILVHKKKTLATVEMKACSNWGTHYERTFELTNEKSKDFWQIIGQCEAHEVNTCYYAVAEPPSNIMDYLFYNGDIMDLYDNFKKECKVTVEIVKSSTVHQQNLVKRIMIAEGTINDWLAENCKQRLDEVLNDNIKSYEANPNKFDKYIAPLHFQKKNFFKRKSKKKKLK